MVRTWEPASESGSAERPKLAPRVPPLRAVHLPDAPDDHAQFQEVLKVDGNVLDHELRSLANATSHSCSSSGPIVSPWIHRVIMIGRPASTPADLGAWRQEFKRRRHI